MNIKDIILELKNKFLRLWTYMNNMDEYKLITQFENEKKIAVAKLKNLLNKDKVKLD
ncbi:hypothetical protein SHELI_v1c09520 [Spiroplasma helicoides]|uniref:Uncharacterized protein n=1 Tax=Spiroplasma helicoides TaxID=216938 RepID=A0A1B3SLT9_9MOLU|nr:hypothetical protein [Spiroplasma helicoides]AOG60901.1 hypothetical protein SHELI_v1c09520 [Spiroplasma helicoides]